jgi:hypothetical protein
MTSYYEFLPSHRQAPSISPIFDGIPYRLRILWNISAQRYYVNCQANDGTMFFTVPLVESLPPKEINSLFWDQLNQRVILETMEPHGLIIGKVININVINCLPTTYNGSGLGFPISKTQIVYPMSTDPGTATTFGSLDMFVNLIKGYYLSTLVYRNSFFEVNP